MAKATKTPAAPEKKDSLAQSDIVAIAAYLAGAASKPIDIEDIAVKANEIAPGRFTWRKYKDQIDREIIYKHLWDLTQEHNGSYVTGSKNDGWMLTLAGTSFTETAAATIHGLNLSKNRLSPKDRDRLKRDRARMLAEAAYVKVSNGRTSDVSLSEAERFFRLDGYVVGEARERRVSQIENEFHDDKQLRATIVAAAQLVRNGK